MILNNEIQLKIATLIPVSSKIRLMIKQKNLEASDLR